MNKKFVKNSDTDRTEEDLKVHEKKNDTSNSTSIVDDNNDAANCTNIIKFSNNDDGYKSSNINDDDNNVTDDVNSTSNLHNCKTLTLHFHSVYASS